MFWLNKDTLKRAILQRCNEIIEDSERGMIDNRKIANYWGRVDIFLGSVTVLSSSITALLTFSQWSKLVIFMACLSFVLSTFYTFLKPSSREAKRRSAYLNFYRLNNKVKDLIIAINSSKLSEQNMLEKLEELSTDCVTITQDLLKSI